MASGDVAQNGVRASTKRPAASTPQPHIPPAEQGSPVVPDRGVMHAKTLCGLGPLHLQYAVPTHTDHIEPRAPPPRCRNVVDTGSAGSAR